MSARQEHGEPPTNLGVVEVVFGPESCFEPSYGSAVTIGAYDGVHLGHRYLIGELRRMAAARGLETVVVTFDRHPATVVRPESAPALLTDLDQKIELLASTGVDKTVVITFDRARADETAEDFVLEVLVRALAARLVVVGRDFHFGRGRRGNVGLLTEMGSRNGFEVVGLGLEQDPGGEVVSSTRIRRALASGEVGVAAGLLGRHHQVRGVVVHGAGRGGSQLGFPTANIEVPTEIAMPMEGVYACWYERPQGQVHPAAASLGYRPTFESPTTDGEGPSADVEARRPPGPPVLEAYILDFEGDVYAESAKVSFVERLRDETRFDSVAELTEAIADDVEQARSILTEDGATVPARAPDQGPC